MGLDQNAFARKENVDEPIMYWRKHADLESWMAELYYKKGGDAEVFNCQELSLTKEDLLRLQKEYTELEKGCGFFWGESNAKHNADTALFIIQALEYLDDGYEIIYTSWW